MGRFFLRGVPGRFRSCIAGVEVGHEQRDVCRKTLFSQKHFEFAQHDPRRLPRAKPRETTTKITVLSSVTCQHLQKKRCPILTQRTQQNGRLGSRHVLLLLWAVIFLSYPFSSRSGPHSPLMPHLPLVPHSPLVTWKATQLRLVTQGATNLLRCHHARV